MRWNTSGLFICRAQVKSTTFTQPSVPPVPGVDLNGNMDFNFSQSALRPSSSRNVLLNAAIPRVPMPPGSTRDHFSCSLYHSMAGTTGHQHRPTEIQLRSAPARLCSIPKGRTQSSGSVCSMSRARRWCRYGTCGTPNSWPNSSTGSLSPS